MTHSDEQKIKSYAEHFFLSQDFAEECSKNVENISQKIPMSSGVLCRKCGRRGKKILLLFRLSPNGIILQKEKEHGYSAELLCGASEDAMCGRILYCNKKEAGIFRKEKEQIILNHFPGEVCKPGEICEMKSEVICKVDKLYGSNLTSIISGFLWEKCINEAMCVEKEIYFTLVNEALCAFGGYLEVIKSIKPDYTFLISYVPDQEGCRLGDGPALTLKNGNAVIGPQIRTMLASIAKNSGLALQSFIGKTNRTIELLSISENTKEIAEICVPVRYENQFFVEIDWKDVEKTLNFLLKIIYEL